MAKVMYVVLAVLAFAPAANTRVTAAPAPTPPLADVVNRELANMFCNYKENENQCRNDLQQLQDALGTNSDVCGKAKVYLDCLDDNCYKTKALSDSIQRVRDRCNAPTTNRRVTATATTTTPKADVVNQELPNLFCNYKSNEIQCLKDLQQLQHALVTNSDVCGKAKVYVDCLDDNCYKTTALSDSIQRVRGRCNAPTTNRRVPATATTTTSLADVINRELPNMFCNYKENENQCRNDLQQLQHAMGTNSNIRGKAIVYLDCLDDNCYKTTALSASIQRVRDRCNGAQSLQATGMLVLLMLAVHLLKV